MKKRPKNSKLNRKSIVTTIILIKLIFFVPKLMQQENRINRRTFNRI